MKTSIFCDINDFMSKIFWLILSIFFHSIFCFGSDYFSEDLIQKINARPMIGMAEELSDLPRFEDTGSLIYPFSGVDISYPVTMFPRINQIVMIDESALHDELLRGSGKLPFEDAPILSSMGMFSGYDLTGMAFRIRGEITKTSEDNRLGTLLLLRLHDLCRLEILSVEELTPEVTEVRARRADHSELRVLHVKSGIGDWGSGLRWLVEKKFDYQVLFAKGASPFIEKPITRSVFSEFKQMMSFSRHFKVVTDLAVGAYRFNGGLAHFFDPRQLNLDGNGSLEIKSSFGYSSVVAVGNESLVYSEYPEVIVREKEDAEIRNRMAREERIRRYQEAQRELEIVRAGDFHTKWSYLVSVGMLKLNDGELSLAWKNGEQSKILDSILLEVFERSPEIRAVKLVVDIHSRVDECLGIIPILDVLKKFPQIKSLSLSATSEAALMSVYAVQVLDSIEGFKSLESLDLQLNDKAAQHSIGLIQRLQKSGSLKRFTVSPIGEWNRAETQEKVNSL